MPHILPARPKYPEPPINLEPFCACDGDGQPVFLQSPFFHPNLQMTSASNGAVILFLPGRFCPAEVNRKNRQAITIKFLMCVAPASAPHGYYVPMSELPEPEFGVCQDCDGDGCPSCEEIGRYPKNRPVMWRNACYGERFLRLISVLPGLHIQNNPLPVSRKHQSACALRFAFAHGLGLLMPRLPPDPSEPRLTLQPPTNNTKGKSTK